MKVFSFSEVTNSRQKGSAAGITCEKSGKRRQPNAKSCFKTKTQARKALWVTLAL